MLGCLVLFGLSKTVTRGWMLESVSAGDYVYDAWSYGDWVTTRNFATVSTYEGPYTLVLAIQPRDSDVETIEITAAAFGDSSGHRVSVLDKLSEKTEKVEKPGSSGIGSPYAPFVFNSLAETNEDIVLEIEFQAIGPEGAKTERQTLEIQGFQSVKHGILIIDQIMGI